MRENDLLDGSSTPPEKVWGVTERWIREFETSRFVTDFITGELTEEGASPAVMMRWAELRDVLAALNANVGKVFTSEDEVGKALFSGPGGGFDIPQVLASAVLRSLANKPGNGAALPTKMPPGVAEKLGTYVYALLDPRDRTIFYVGKGRGDRVYSHVWAAMGEASRIQDGKDSEPAAVRSAKVSRIKDIYSSGEAVEHFILRHQIEPGENADKAALAIEQTLIDALRLVETSGDTATLTNIAGGHTKTELGVLPLTELIRRYAAVPAPPIEEPHVVLVVNAAKDPLKSKEEVYDAGRGWWKAGVPARNTPQIPIFFIAADIVRAVYRADTWEQKADGVWAFNGKADAELEAKYVGTSLAEVKKARSNGRWREHGWHPYL